MLYLFFLKPLLTFHEQHSHFINQTVELSSFNIAEDMSNFTKLLDTYYTALRNRFKLHAGLKALKIC